MRPIHPGTRVRLKVRTIGGWQGVGTVLRRVYDDCVELIPDKDLAEGKDWHMARVICGRDEVARLRDQTPHPAWLIWYTAYRYEMGMGWEEAG